MLLESHQIRQSFWPCWRCADLSPVKAGLLILQRCPQAAAALGSLISVWLPLGKGGQRFPFPFATRDKLPASSSDRARIWKRTQGTSGITLLGQQTALATFYSVVLVTFLPHERWTEGEGPKTDTDPIKPASKFHNEVLGLWHCTRQIHHRKIQWNKPAPDNFRAWEYVQYHLKLGEINFPDSLFKRQVGCMIKRNKPLSDALLHDQQK